MDTCKRLQTPARGTTTKIKNEVKSTKQLSGEKRGHFITGKY
jgi:hypothetical protein